MIISFGRARHCARCKRRVGRTDKGYMDITPLDGWLRITVRFRCCSECFDDITKGMQRVHEEHPDTSRFSHNIEGLA
jgi:hypothetical protein